MHHQSTIATIALAAALCAASAGARAFEDSRYPDLRGQWVRATTPGTMDEPRFDPSKPPGRGQQPPLTPEYQAIFEANLREREAGVPGTWPGPSCLPPGMPAQMTAYRPLEFIILPNVTYIRIDYIRETRRRIFTDGRTWPTNVEDGFDGYSIGKWIDENNDGKYDVLEVETRHFKGPRQFDLSGIPLHEDNETIIKERIFLDKANPGILHDEITTTDNSLTRPWTVTKNYRRVPGDITWEENNCVEGNAYITINGEVYVVSGDGLLMPSKKDQAPPDLRYFKPPAK